MTKTARGADGQTTPDELDAAIAALRRQLTALEKLKQARTHLADQERISRELLRRRRSNLALAETEVRESGALTLLATPPDAE